MKTGCKECDECLAGLFVIRDYETGKIIEVKNPEIEAAEELEAKAKAELKIGEKSITTKNSLCFQCARNKICSILEIVKQESGKIDTVLSPFSAKYFSYDLILRVAFCPYFKFEEEKKS